MSDTPGQRGGWVPRDTFSSRLLLIRAEMRLTVEEAAAACNLKPATWSTWERGASPRNMAHVVGQIHTSLGVSRDWLMWGDVMTGGRAGPDFRCSQSDHAYG